MIALPMLTRAQSPPAELEAIEVLGEAGDVERLARPGGRLSGEALRTKAAATLGDTLSSELGVSNASFGPGVGLPVVRGLSGSRVRLMQDSIASHDASAVSPDHASSLEAGLAEEIRVIRGPAVLEYGGNAIGGIVDVVDNRIPEALPERPVMASIETRHDSNGARRSGSLRFDAGRGPIAVHADGFYRGSGDTDIPGDALDIAALTEQFGEDDYVTSSGVIDNTDAEAKGGSAGLSVVGDRGFAGLSINRYENDYGVPPGFHVDRGVAQEVRIDAEQTRFDFKAALYDLGDAVPELRVRAGVVDYEHEEFEAGRPGTRFSNEAVEARVALDYDRSRAESDAFIDGTAGVQVLDRDFSALGVEAFVPRSSQTMLGAFLIESLETSDWRFEYGMRVELNEIEQRDAIDCVGLGVRFDRGRSTFTAVSASAAATWKFRPDATARLSLSRAQRAPDIQELLACGPHLATQTYDLAFGIDGEADFELETFHSLDLGLTWDRPEFSVDLNLFYSAVDDFIFQRNLSTANNGPFFNPDRRLFQGTCASASQCLPVMQYTQRDATLVGYEVQVDVPLRESASATWTLSLFSDYVRAELDDGEDVPRVPPLRAGASVALSKRNVDAELRFTHAFAQDRPGANETATDSYNLLNASLSYRRRLGSTDATFFVNARNILDEEIRSSTSFLRNYAPEPGRSLELGLRLEF